MNTAFVDVDSGSDKASLGALGGTSGEIILAVLSYVQGIQAKGDEVTTDNLLAILNGVIKSLTNDKININHSELKEVKEKDNCTGVLADDFANEGMEEELAEIAANNLGTSITFSIIESSAEELGIDLDALRRVQKELIKLACTSAKDKFSVNEVENK